MKIEEYISSSFTSSATSSPFNYNALMSLSSSSSPSLSSPCLQEFMSPGQRGIRLINLLQRCVLDISAGNFDRANECLESISSLTSQTAAGEGYAMQRLASYFADALARRLLLGRFACVHRALLSSSDCADRQLVAAARDHFYEHLPFLKMAFATSNQAILEAMEDEKAVHIVDLSGPYANPDQWLSLLHSIRHQANPSPHLRITVVHDDVDFLRHISTRLTAVADNYHMSFQFHPVEARLDTLDFDKLHVKSGEAVAITSLFNLHRLLLTADSKNRPSYIPYPTLSLATFDDLLRDDHGHNHTKLLIDSFLSSLHALSP